MSAVRTLAESLPSREQMIEEHLPLVRYVVSRMSASFFSSVMEIEDAIGYGIAGLIQAVDKYDPSRGAAFTTFATQRIRGAIIDAARQQDLLPRSARANMREIEAASLDLAQMLGRWPTVRELALRTNLPINQLRDLQRLRGALVVSLEQTSENDEGFDWEVVDQDESVDPQGAMDRRALSAILDETLRKLPERERKVLDLRYNRDLPFTSIARLLNISESRVCQIHTRIVRDLRDQLDKARAA